MTQPALGRLVDVTAADVYKTGRLAARLQRGQGTISFAYDADYLAGDGSSVATSLPASDQPVVTSGGAVPPYFAGLLPEGRRLTSLRQAVKTSSDDELTLLLAVGRDAVGDVQVVPSGEQPTAAEALITVDRSFAEVRFADVLDAAGIVDPVALAGVQDKASARMLSVPVTQAGRRYILKVDPPEYPHVVENEAYFLGRAAGARWPVVQAEVVHDATGRPGLLVQRFDRVAGPDGSTLALAVEDAGQVLGIYPADKYRVTAEAVTRGLSEVCASQVVAAREIFRQLCFAWLTGNGDVHAKNLSVLATASGEWRVSPAYDLPSTLPYRDHTLALAMAGRRKGLSRKSLLEFAGSVGVPERAAERTLDDVLRATQTIADEIEGGALPFSSQVVRDIVRSLRQRHRTALS
ncbi:type II toxin-antitoxin system HipA family toxin [Angustibacter sp. McL0619]|uniref:type II toxin-antitoxin system HipA family toxin n=1 Tax=Angustibacter sp. McL0619 TaxID=3415676 RepID=UPI003CF437C7